MIRLTVVKPDGQTLIIDQSSPARLTIGRGSDCNIRLDSDTLSSRRHAVFLIDPPLVSVQDLGSTNGLDVNGRRRSAEHGAAPAPIPLADGDQVRIGQTRIKISVVERAGKKPRTTQRRALTTHRKETNSLPKKPASRNTRPIPRRPSSTPPPPPPPPPDEIADTGPPKGPDTPTDGFDTVSDLPPVRPRVPGWELTRFLAHGLNGSVYMGEDKSGATLADAVKIIAPGKQLKRAMLERLRRETDEARRASHAGIARIAASGEIADGGAFLAYEFVSGSSLSVHLETFEERRLPYPAAYQLMMQLTEAVCFLHRRDIVHMDLKPSSVMVQVQGGRRRVKLTDHGFHGFLEDIGLAIRGNPGKDPRKLGFVAPEETNPYSEAMPTADVFALSAIFYYLLTGKSPYRFAPGRDNLKVVRDGWMQPVEELCPKLPATLSVVIDRGLSPDLDMRYQDACALREALEDVST